MGGLAGLIALKGDAPDRGVLEAMSQRLAHRGPDGMGVYFDGPAGLAHRRRAVLESKAAQPLVTDEVVVLLDGTLTDHAEVARQAGLSDAPETDTETLLAAWRRWGPDLAQRVDGHFAAAIWERRSRTLHLVRDRVGSRPLYWARSASRFAFASEIPALLAVPWVSRELAREHLAEYLAFRVVHAPRTLLRDVHQVEPAHWLRLRAEGLETRRYWQPAYAAPTTPKPRESDVVPALQEAVEHAVKRRLRGGAPTGLYLSGGLGSTAIAAAARSLHRDLPTFTIAFADDPYPEAPFAGRIARLLGLEHHDVVIGSHDVATAFPAAVAALGHPIGHPAFVLQHLLAQAAGERVRVVFSGDGSDELFGGRMLDDIVRWMRVARAFQRVPQPTRGTLGWLLSRTERGKRIATPPERYGLDLGIGGSRLFRTEDRAALLRDAALTRPTVRFDVLTPFYANLDTDPINAVLHAYQRSWLSEESLPRADRMAASGGLDPSYPLLDRAVLTMAIGLPGSFKVRRRGGSLHSRWPLRAMLSGVLPAPLVNRPKRGMPAPLDRWLVGPGRLFLEDRLARLKRDPHGLFRPEALDRLRKDLPRAGGAGLKLWSLFILDEWLRTLDAR